MVAMVCNHRDVLVWAIALCWYKGVSLSVIVGGASGSGQVMYL